MSFDFVARLRKPYFLKAMAVWTNRMNNVSFLMPPMRRFKSAIPNHSMTPAKTNGWDFYVQTPKYHKSAAHWGTTLGPSWLPRTHPLLLQSIHPI